MPTPQDQIPELAPHKPKAKVMVRSELPGALARQLKVTSALRGKTITRAVEEAVREWLRANGVPAPADLDENVWARMFRTPDRWQVAIYHCQAEPVERRPARGWSMDAMYHCPNCHGHVSSGALRLEPVELSR